MYARIRYPSGTDMIIEINQFSEHAIENEPGRFSLYFDRKDEGWGVGMNVESEKDLSVYIMNDNGQTIDSKHYQK